MPSLSVRPRSASMECVPANADEPSRLRPNRAPSSSAQSTRRTVTGGRPLYCSCKFAQHFERGQHSQAAVQPAAIGDRIEMAANQQGLLRFARQSDPAIPGGIVVILYRKAVQLGGEPFARLEPRIGPGHALRAVRVGGERAQFFQFGDGSLRVDAHRSVRNTSARVSAGVRGRVLRRTRRLAPALCRAPLRRMDGLRSPCLRIRCSRSWRAASPPKRSRDKSGS